MNWRACVAAIILGCGPSAGGDDDGGADDGATTDTSGASASVGSATTESTTPGTSASSSPTTTATTGVDGSDDVVDDGSDDVVDDGSLLDVGGATCDFETVVHDAADASKVPPLDCGLVTLADDVAAWEAAYACVTDALAAQGAVEVIWQPMGIDSDVYAALVGVVGEAYAIAFYSYDSLGDPQISAQSCGAVAHADDCSVDVGEMCLYCTDTGDLGPVCVLR